MKASAKLKIQELLSRAAYYFDERRLEDLEDCFAPNATMLVNITGVGDVGPFDGREAIMQLMSQTLESQTDVRRHVVSNFFFVMFYYQVLLRILPVFHIQRKILE